MASKQKIIPCIWYNHNGEEAVDFYLSIFPEGKKGKVGRYPKNDMMPQLEGKTMTVEFELFGQQYLALNGGPEFPHTNAVSFMVACKDQKEIDSYWDKLLAGGGKPIQCGWLTDKYGLSWQVYWEDMMQYWNADPKTAKRVMDAMHKMVKLDIAELKRAAAGDKKAA